MTTERMVILDGTAEHDPRQDRTLAALAKAIERQGGMVEPFTLRDERMAHCIGCFGCWLETPGVCRAADRGRDIVRSMINAETVILITPVTYGGYSSSLKFVVDRWVQVLLPFFEIYRGELHHPLRYGRFPRLIAIGIQPQPDPAEAEIFRTLVARNATNFRAPSFAVDIIDHDEPDDALEQRMMQLLSRQDPPYDHKSLATLVPPPIVTSEIDWSKQGKRAVVLVGSPKTKKPSTSSVLGNHLLARLKDLGWDGETLTITAAIRDEVWREKFFAAVLAADLVILAFPLYIDALPTLLTRTLEWIGKKRQDLPSFRPQRLVTLVNSGFPEAHQNLVALAICAQFASAAHMTWAGGLAMGAGEALSSGVALTGPSSDKARPPVGHVIAALDKTAMALAAGRPVPPEAAALIARTPIPLLPFKVWRRFFAFMGGQHWRVDAVKNGVNRAALLARPWDTLMSEPKLGMDAK